MTDFFFEMSKFWMTDDTWASEYAVIVDQESPRAEPFAFIEPPGMRSSGISGVCMYGPVGVRISGPSPNWVYDPKAALGPSLC